MHSLPPSVLHQLKNLSLSKISRSTQMMQEASPPIGYKFSPSDEDIIFHYLHNKIHRKQLPNPPAVIECDLYGENNAWTKFFEQSGESTLYFFTKLRKKTDRGSRVDRVTGCGTWRTQNDTKIIKYHGDKKLHIGSRRNFTFVPKNGSGVQGRWVMHEYRLDGILSKARKDVDDYVFCRVKKKKKKSAVKEEEEPVEVQPLNTVIPAWNTSEDLEIMLLDSYTDESDLNFNLGITPEELDDILAT